MGWTRTSTGLRESPGCRRRRRRRRGTDALSGPRGRAGGLIWVTGSGGVRFRVQGVRFRIQGVRFRVQGVRFRIQGVRFRIQGVRFRIQGVRFRVQGVCGLGFRV
jgi:hypothetical protein